MAYAKEFKNSIVSKMLPPRNQSLDVIHTESGVPMGTLKEWQRQLRQSGNAAPAGETRSEKWSTRDKFLIVVETASMNEIELAEYSRKKGLFVEQVKSWQENCLQANGGVAQELAEARRREKDTEKVLRRTQKELQRKDSALAEAAALLILSKKYQAIWASSEVGEN